MHKKTFLLISLIFVFCLAGSVSARDYWWSDLDDANHLWSSWDNWCSKDDANDPNPEMSLPTLADIVYIGKGELHVSYPTFLYDMVKAGTTTISPPEIADGVVAEANSIWLGSGNSLSSTPDPCSDAYMNITGGSLTVGRTQPWTNWWGEGGLYIGLVDGGTGTLTISGGDVYVGSHIEIGAWQGTGTLVMEGGTVNVEHGIWCPSTGYAAEGYLDLHGGTIYADSFNIYEELNPLGGIMDVTEGTMILRGNESDQILSYVEGVWNSNKNRWLQKIFAYGLEHGTIGGDGLRAIVEVDYDFRNSDSTTVTAAKIDPDLAWDPAPYMGQTGVEGTLAALTRPKLAWKAGETASVHHLYFGTDFNDVNDADEFSEFYEGEFVLDANYWTCDEDLEYHEFYYWRVDEEDGSEQIIKGDTWMFRMANLGAASDPFPEADPPAEDVSPLVTLSWTPGLDVLRHKLYLSTDYNDVYDCNDSAFLTIQDPNTYNYYVRQGLPLERDATYYWRVDEVNGSGGLVWPGDIWSFTTADYVSVDEFEYGSDKNLRKVWEDGWVNETGSLILPTGAFVYSGSKAMEFQYWNSLYDHSEISAETSGFGIGSDWTILGVEALSLWFEGNPNNDAERMYFGLEDSGGAGSYVEVVYDGDPNDLKVAKWKEWAIDLDEFSDGGIDLTDVQKVYIGFGDRSILEPGGDGFVYLDAMRLYPARCVSAKGPAGDLDGDCFTDYNDLAIMREDWLLEDFNTLGYPGTLVDFNENNLMWHPCDGNSVDGGSLEFALGHEADPVEGWTTSPDHVEIAPLSLYTNELTITAWVKRKGIQYPFSGIVFCRYDHDGDGLFKSEGDTCAGISFGRDHELRYHWDDDYWNVDKGLYIADQTWTFVALTVEPVQSFLYVRPLGGSLDFDYHYKPHVAEEFIGPTCIGQDSHNQPRNIRGLVDDVRIYRRTLSENEIRYLSSLGTEGVEPTDTPRAWYKLDESSGFLADDSGERELHYWPVPSVADLYDGEPQYQRYVNMRDYALLADTWLEEKMFP